MFRKKLTVWGLKNRNEVKLNRVKIDKKDLMQLMEILNGREAI